MTYASFQKQVSSEKLTLAIVQASKRLMAWTLHSGSIYKITNFDVQSIVSLEDSGTAYTEVFSVLDVTAAKFYNDRENRILYLRTTGSDNPNGRFLSLTFRLFFSTAPITLPCDLASGTEVFWEPSIKSTSQFGVEIDTVNQTSEAIEGSGSLSLYNDGDFWPRNYDKLTFENKPCYIYSHNRDLDPSEAKLIYKGTIQSKSYNSTQIDFKLNDLLSVLKDAVPLGNLEDLGYRVSTDLLQAKQRMILGRVYGHRLVNLDEVLDGYPLTGTVAINHDSNVLTGTGTQFLTDLSPDDKLIINGNEYTVGTVTSNTAATLTENLGGSSDLSGVSVTIVPNRPKRKMNRAWFVAGHAIRQPTAQVGAGSSVSKIFVDSTKDIYAGDVIYIGTLGSGELAKVKKIINSKIIELVQSLNAIPAKDSYIFKPGVQNVRIDDVLLQYERDYSFDASTGILTLEDKAEEYAAPLKQMSSNLAFTNGSRVVTGTDLKTTLKAGDVVSCVGEADFFEVLSVDSDTQVTLRTPSTFTATATGLYKNFILDPQNSVVTCDVLGRTDDGTPTGALIDNAPFAVQTLLRDMGLGSIVYYDSFDEARAIAYQPIGLVIPSQYDDSSTPTYRDVLKRINTSVFGSVIQNNDFLLGYYVLQPDKKTTALKLFEPDVLDFKVTNTSENMIKTAVVNYRSVEYDYVAKDKTNSYTQSTSDNSTYLVKTNRERTFDTVLVEETDAERHAKRWLFILENATGTVSIKTKLQGISLDIGSIVDLTHRKLYERFGSSSNRKLGLVQSAKKTGTEVTIEIVDLSNAFNRVASITSITTDRSNTNEDGRIYGGFYTDQYGLIDNDPDSFGNNLIW